MLYFCRLYKIVSQAFLVIRGIFLPKPELGGWGIPSNSSEIGNNENSGYLIILLSLVVVNDRIMMCLVVECCLRYFGYIIIISTDTCAIAVQRMLLLKTATGCLG